MSTEQSQHKLTDHFSQCSRLLAFLLRICGDCVCCGIPRVNTFQTSGRVRPTDAFLVGDSQFVHASCQQVEEADVNRVLHVLQSMCYYWSICCLAPTRRTLESNLWGLFLSVYLLEISKQGLH